MRLSVSIPDKLGQEVHDRAATQRRKLSNMVALLLEAGLSDPHVGNSVSVSSPQSEEAQDK